MRSSILISALCAASALAKPIAKRAIVEDIVVVTDIVYTTVTEGAEPTPEAKAFVAAAPSSHGHRHKHPASKSAAAPSVILTTVIVTPTQEAVVVVTVQPTPEPTTEAAVFIVTSQAAPVAIVSTPVVVAAAPASSTAAAVVVPASSAVDSSLNAYQSTAVLHHNMHRRNHSAPDVAWSAKLAKSAATLAAKCVFEHDMTIDGGGYGQNIASISASDLNTIDVNSVVATTITNAWYYGEANNWVFGTASSDMDTQAKQWLHFTQVIWVGSTTVGCATQKCAAGTMDPTLATYYTVCNYGPQGNVSPLFATNVLPPKNLAAFTAAIVHTS